MKFRKWTVWYAIILPCVIYLGCKQASDQVYPALQESTSHLQQASMKPFYHGVASGDPYPNSVVLWTRITPDTQLPEISVDWELATDTIFDFIVAHGTSVTGPEMDYTVKVIAKGLNPGTHYYYRFKGLGSVSPKGKTKTASGKKPLSLAIVSCSNIEFGYFNAYDAIADEPVNAVLHLGDYIYEYGPDVYGDKQFERKNIPDHEIITLQDYRDRYAQYRLDKNLKRVHASHPFINIWDDHEITNNAYVDGAQNHQEDEGSYEKRKAAAKKAFYEWLPIRDMDVHYRSFNYGTLAEIIMLDERLAGRTAQAKSLEDSVIHSDQHSLLGDEQFSWLANQLSSSKAIWKVIGNQVIFSYCDWAYDRFRFNMDAWDGYPGEQIRLADHIKDNNIDNIVFVTGDTHRAWAFEATHDPFGTSFKNDGGIATEFGVTSITSGNADESNPVDEVLQHENKMSDPSINPHLKYVNMRDHGYLVLKMDQDSLVARFKTVSTIKDSIYQTKTDTTLVVLRGTTIPQ